MTLLLGISFFPAIPAGELAEAERALPEELRPVRVQADPERPRRLDLSGPHQTHGVADPPDHRYRLTPFCNFQLLSPQFRGHIADCDGMLLSVTLCCSWCYS